MEFNCLFDKSIGCYSVMKTITISEYFEIVNDVYKRRGGLTGQRPALKTSTAIRIRNRMIQDLKLGAILPPVVIGIIVDDSTIERFDECREIVFGEIYINTIKKGEVTIIDGMQRTTALYEGISDNSIDMNNLMRVEFWLTNKVNNIVYRMLVLNTGQIPWNVKRQLEVVFEPLINSLEKEVKDIMLIRVDETSKRNRAGIYQANQFVELYLNFATRKENLDIEDALTEEFAKLDLIQVTANKDFTDMFVRVAEFFVKMDSIFSRYTGTLQDDDSNTKFKEGKDIFTSQPARVGFFVACARAILGIPGIDKNVEEQKQCADVLFENFQNFIKKLESMTHEEIGVFLCLNVIDEVITFKKSGKVGEYERTVFLKAFERIIDSNFNIEIMNPCWRAYV